MGESKAVASLSSGLLARKGGAKPAIRPQVQTMNESFEHMPSDMASLAPDDICDRAEESKASGQQAEIVSITGKESSSQDTPDIVIQQEKLASRVQKPAAARRSALADGRRAAFTLRIDAERHMKLRLASTMTNRSAQQLVTEALDSLLDKMPDLQSLAEKVRKHS